MTLSVLWIHLSQFPTYRCLNSVAARTVTLGEQIQNSPDDAAFFGRI